jgi:hypothetical protein
MLPEKFLTKGHSQITRANNGLRDRIQKQETQWVSVSAQTVQQEVNKDAHDRIDQRGHQ